MIFCQKNSSVVLIKKTFKDILRTFICLDLPMQPWGWILAMYIGVSPSLLPMPPPILIPRDSRAFFRIVTVF